MARILVISDVHGNLEDLTHLLNHETYDQVFFLGDYIGDLLGYCSIEDGNKILEVIQSIERPDNIIIKGNHEAMCLAESGKGHERFVSLMKSMPDEMYTIIDGFSFYLKHDPGNLNPQYISRANIILSGHLHTFGIKNISDTIRVQAGTLMHEGRSTDVARLLHAESTIPWADGHLGRTYIIIDTQELFLQIRKIPDLDMSHSTWRLLKEVSLSKKRF